MTAINIAREFSTTPGPRTRTEGRHSGEEFRESILGPRFRQAQDAGEKLQVELDGVKFGYPTSFLEEAFGGLARELGIEVVQQGLAFSCSDEPSLETEIRRYIDDAMRTGPERSGK
jgi:hypothetical protein